MYIAVVPYPHVHSLTLSLFTRRAHTHARLGCFGSTRARTVPATVVIPFSRVSCARSVTRLSRSSIASWSTPVTRERCVCTPERISKKHHAPKRSMCGVCLLLFCAVIYSRVCALVCVRGLFCVPSILMASRFPGQLLCVCFFQVIIPELRTMPPVAPKSASMISNGVLI